jgi:hypothetical protein
MAEIPSTPADGNTKVVFVPTLADPAAPSLAELTGASAVELSCYLTGSGLSPSIKEDTVTDERLCSTQTFEQPGRKTDSLEIEYIDNTNSPNEATSNKATDTLTEGTTGYLVVRRGVDYETAFAATSQKVTVYPVTAMTQNELPPEANSVQKISQKLAVTGAVRRRVTIAA